MYVYATVFSPSAGNVKQKQALFGHLLYTGWCTKTNSATNQCTFKHHELRCRSVKHWNSVGRLLYWKVIHKKWGNSKINEKSHAMPIGTLLGLRQLLATANPLRIMRNAFCFPLKSLFVLNMFKFL